jgi:hypothetical protein
MAGRYREAKELGLWDRSRRPSARAGAFAGGGRSQRWQFGMRIRPGELRKIRTRLEALSGGEVPAGSTIHAILRRHERVNLSESRQHQPGNASSGKLPISCGRWTMKRGALGPPGSNRHPKTRVGPPSPAHALCWKRPPGVFDSPSVREFSQELSWLHPFSSGGCLRPQSRCDLGHHQGFLPEGRLSHRLRLLPNYELQVSARLTRTFTSHGIHRSPGSMPSDEPTGAAAQRHAWTPTAIA